MSDEEERSTLTMGMTWSEFAEEHRRDHESRRLPTLGRRLFESLITDDRTEIGSMVDAVPDPARAATPRVVAGWGRHRGGSPLFVVADDHDAAEPPGPRHVAGEAMATAALTGALRTGAPFIDLRSTPARRGGADALLRDGLVDVGQLVVAAEHIPMLTILDGPIDDLVLTAASFSHVVVMGPRATPSISSVTVDTRCTDDAAVLELADVFVELATGTGGRAERPALPMLGGLLDGFFDGRSIELPATRVSRCVGAVAGRAIGVVAVDGELDSNEVSHLDRFVRLCDSLHAAVVVLDGSASAASAGAAAAALAGDPTPRRRRRGIHVAMSPAAAAALREREPVLTVSAALTGVADRNASVDMVVEGDSLVEQLRALLVTLDVGAVTPRRVSRSREPLLSGG